MKHFVYILFSEKLGKYYVGKTSLTVEDRLLYHLSNHKGFTSKAKDWIIVDQEQLLGARHKFEQV